MKEIEEIQPIKGDAYEYYNTSGDQYNLFEKIFLVDEIMEDIQDPTKYFIIGEKGSSIGVRPYKENKIFQETLKILSFVIQSI